MPITRRDFLLASALGAALASGKGWAGRAAAAATERRDLYPQGVASGDPTADSVILWTRRPPTGGNIGRRLVVEVAETPDFASLVAGGHATVGPETDWTCRFLATGLAADREYWYRFVDEHGFASRTGRTLTAPAEDAEVPVRFSFASCQSPNDSALEAYRRMIFEDERAPADQRLQFVLHLGDFIYEVTWYAADNPGGRFRGRRLRDRYRFPDGEKVGNFHLPVSLEDYRTLYRSYLEDPDLQDARARWPFVCVWDNHEFAWAGYQSQYVAPGVDRPSQRKKVIANQAWWEFIPARVVKPGDPSVDRFDPPAVEDVPISRFDADGLGDEPNNLAAIRSLRIQRTLRFGRNVELFLTDHHSFRSPGPDAGAFAVPGTRFVSPGAVEEILDAGRTYDGGHPPATIPFLGQELPNPAHDGPAQTYLGREQREWLLGKLGESRARWKIWGHSFGTLALRSDFANLPAETGVQWPANLGYALASGGFRRDNDAVFDFVRERGITGFAILAGDRHAFQSGLVSKTLPPKAFDPVGVEFVTGSISQQTLQEVAEIAVPKDDPLRALYVGDRPNGPPRPALNTTFLHGVRAALALQETGDIAAARARRNPEVAPHLRFLDRGGHGYGQVTAGADALQVDFVGIPRPLEASGRADGGPLAYRARHRAPLWRAGEVPTLEVEVVEGEAPYST